MKKKHSGIFFFLFLGLFIPFIHQASGSSPVSFTAEDLSKRIEKRRGTWIALKAAVEIGFTTSENQKASCQGTLLYHRLDESIRLDCLSSKNQLIFTFKTSDRDFELYLPAQRTLYQGNIFSLEDSPAIESHLRAWDLYRAFKPSRILSEGVTLTQAPEGLISAEVHREGSDLLDRSLLISNQGDILSDTYYDLSGVTAVEIKREQFEKIVPAPASEIESAFPHKIIIRSHLETKDSEGFNTTEFDFKKLDFSADLNEQDFKLTLPDDIRTVVLEDSPS